MGSLDRFLTITTDCRHGVSGLLRRLTKRAFGFRGASHRDFVRSLPNIKWARSIGF
jgi:hypothetical protein